ncbi:MAG TPA: glycoside hydrolase family 47 protein [Jatrophihabitans sp.]|jgi:mannosyl-oligosaccharide alpha-1,2-mannosidase|nr:glycoside hydrolase family 47 protein [Jatrophihabitans sp.]
MGHRSLSRRAFLEGLTATGAAVAFGQLPGVADAAPRAGTSATTSSAALYPELANDVRDGLLLTYNKYLELAGDFDQLKPLSGTGTNFFTANHSIGLTRIEVLDTLYLMELDDELAAAVDYIVNEVSFDIDVTVEVFEAVIRVVGGLLSGYHATQDPRLLAKAKDMADRLFPVYAQSPTGLPYRFVNLHTGAVSGTTNNCAEIGSTVAEFGDLSRLTGDPKYLKASVGAQKAVFDRRSSLDLIGTWIDILTGEWTVPNATINPPVDSFHEYLFDGWDFLQVRSDLTRFKTLTDAILKRLSFTANGNKWFATVDMNTGAQVDTEQSELASFYAGLLGQGGYLAAGRAFHDSWKAALDTRKYRVLPEGLDPATFEPTSKGNQLRPEYVDSAFNLWLTTGEQVYVDRAVEYYKNVKATSLTPNGYTILTDVVTETQGDFTSAYWYSENMKYYYLMFGRSDRFNYTNNYLSTEGNVLRGLLGV